jgi:diadenosine tetraphosphate (Ap4A) HIT family hydrolase
MDNPICPFCVLQRERIWLETATTIVVFDGYPVSEKHKLLVPKRHVPSIPTAK